MCQSVVRTTASGPVQERRKLYERPDNELIELIGLYQAKWLTSAAAFLAGAALPLLVILLGPAGWRVPVTFIVVLAALAVTGAVGAQLRGSSEPRAAVRVVIGGDLAATYTIGLLLGANRSGVMPAARQPCRSPTTRSPEIIE